MIGRFGWRVIELVVLLFAFLGFVFVPLGRHTAFEHVQAILATRAAQEAGQGLVQATHRLQQTVLDGVQTGVRELNADSGASFNDAGAPRGAPARGAGITNSTRGHEPKAVVPIVAPPSRRDVPTLTVPAAFSGTQAPDASL